MLSAIQKIIEDKITMWPEISRLVLTYKMQHTQQDFGPNKDAMLVILDKLVGMRPQHYNEKFSFDEKICLLTVMIDEIHDTDDFRQFLNQRVEEKSSYNKEKMEVYQTISALKNQ